MRATRSDALILEECFVPDSAVLLRSDDVSRLRQTNLHWFWGSYTPVYLGVAQAAFDECGRWSTPAGRKAMLSRSPIIPISVDMSPRSAPRWRRRGSSPIIRPGSATPKGLPRATAALYRAKYLVGEAVSGITRTALTLGGAHGIFKTSRLEQLFRDGALGPLHPPPSDFCLYNLGLYELGLNAVELLPPMKPEQASLANPDAGAGKAE
jgi:alkylation response protein AidB-like acyl-CoA dehydrogenase